LKISPSPWGEILASVIWGKKYEQGKRKKGVNARKEGKRKKEKEKEKIRSKRVKKVQNKEELMQKGHDRSWKTVCRRIGKNIIFRRGVGINIVFGPKNRPLP
jgi:hypothetical protein